MILPDGTTWILEIQRLCDNEVRQQVNTTEI